MNSPLEHFLKHRTQEEAIAEEELDARLLAAITSILDDHYSDVVLWKQEYPGSDLGDNLQSMLVVSHVSSRVVGGRARKCSYALYKSSKLVQVGEGKD
tara:strand:+ start:207 stop:500 length:294 start_codon:yes stop_codon:yes gene_type:complete